METFLFKFDPGRITPTTKKNKVQVKYKFWLYKVQVLALLALFREFKS